VYTTVLPRTNTNIWPYIQPALNLAPLAVMDQCHFISVLLNRSKLFTAHLAVDARELLKFFMRDLFSLYLNQPFSRQSSPFILQWELQTKKSYEEPAIKYNQDCSEIHPLNYVIQNPTLYRLLAYICVPSE